MNNSYHSLYKASFFLGCLPTNELNKIPRSTKHEWTTTDQSQLTGNDWVENNKTNFDTIQQMLHYNNLLQINRALLKIIVLSKLIQTKTTHFNKTIYQNILKLKPILGIKKTLKYIGISYQQYHKLKQPKKCKLSVFKQCLIQHPNQLHQQEVDIIQQYCNNPKYQFWKLISIFHQIRRDHTAFFSLRTFYKYANAAGFRRQKIPTRRKNHSIGIRAGKPLEILHVDTTILRLLDNSKAFIHLIQDNFSRAILGVIVSQKCLAQNTFDNITQVYEKHLKDKIDFNPIIITDDGSENKGEFKEFTQKAMDPSLIHKIAQSIHFHFSNSMIENANKQLKYCFLYHQKIEDFEHLLPFVQKAIEDFNNRPHGVLNGFTPMEVLNGQLPLKKDYSEQIAIATTNRIELNRKIKACCVI